MIQIKNDGELIIDAEDVSQMMQEASMLIMAVVRQAQDVIPADVPLDYLVQDLFKSLRYAALLDDGKTEEEALMILNGKVENKPEIDLG